VDHDEMPSPTPDRSLKLGNCDRCGAPLIEIENDGSRLTGCVACNVWRGDKGCYVVELDVEDWEALGIMPESIRWTLRPRKIR